MTEETPTPDEATLPAAIPAQHVPAAEEAEPVTATLARVEDPAVTDQPAATTPIPAAAPTDPMSLLAAVIEEADASTLTLPKVTMTATPKAPAEDEHAYAVPGRRRPSVVAGTALLVALMVGAVVYLMDGGEGGGPAKSGATWLPEPTPAATSALESPSASALPSLSPSASPSGSGAAGMAVGPHTVKINAQGWWSWSLMDLRTGQIWGSSNLHQTSKTASMIKAWIGADFLRREAEAGRTPSDTRLDQVVTMIRDSNNTSATSLFAAVGQAESTTRMIQMCGLKDAVAFDNWSNTLISTSDTVRLGACIASGKAAGKKWTAYLLNEMRHVRGEGNFGIRKAFPSSIQGSIAIKNGWVIRNADNQWNVNCLAIGDGWSMAVETRFPVSLGMDYGANICKQVAAQLRN